jgi:S1-C subfamily serine protease
VRKLPVEGRGVQDSREISVSWSEQGPGKPQETDPSNVSTLRRGFEEQAPRTSQRRARRVLAGTVIVLLLAGSAAADALLLARVNRNNHRVDALTASLGALQKREHDDASQLDALLEQVTGDENRTLDASAVASHAKPAVFTVIAGNFLGTAFGFYKEGSATYLVTNYHVVETATLEPTRTVTVRQERSTWTGEVEKWNSHFDLALVRVDADLPVLLSASSQGHEPAVGEPVMAYGSPYGLEDTATVGIISAFRKQYIQTDAPINHGNSGGPLLDPYGDVVGITSYGVGSGGSGLGLAIDVGEVCQVLVTADIC